MRAQRGLDKSGSIHNSQEDTRTPNPGGKSLGRFADSQSGHQLSERRPQHTANHSTGQMPYEGDIHNRSAHGAADSFLHKSTSRDRDGKSLASLDRSRGSRLSPSQKSVVNIVDQTSKMTNKHKGTMEVLQKNQLTHERVHALRLFAKDLKSSQPREERIPIEVENHFCSHISPAMSAHMIQANDLNALDKNNPYRFWENRDRQTRTENFKAVPKSFYTNYKTSLMRDAHEVAKAVSAGINDPSHQCGCKDEIKCDCRKADKNKLHRLNLKNQWKSRIKGRSTRKDTRQMSYEMHKPYRPCRRSCSSTHNPLFHAQRMHNEHMQRLH